MTSSPAGTAATTMHTGTTLVVLDRSHRPGAGSDHGSLLPTPSGPCPFCPGGEDRLLSPQTALADPAGRRTALAFPNIAPLVPAPDGVHEVVVLCGSHTGHLLEDAHDTGPTCLPGLVLLADRMRTARERGLVAHGIVNHGRLAGASQPHAHAQMLAVDAPSTWLARELPHLAERGSCPVCAPAAGTVVTETESLRVVAPAHPSHSHELLVAPHEHLPHFDVTDADVLAELAHVLGDLGRRTRAAWGPFAYNLVWHQAPAEEAFHWHVHLVPRRIHPSAFELDWAVAHGTGHATAALLAQH